MSLFLPIVVYKEDLSTLEKADAYVLKYCTNENIEKIYDTLLENDIDEEKVSNIKTCIILKIVKITIIYIGIFLSCK